MDDTLNVGILLEDGFHCLHIATVCLYEFWALSCNLLDAVNDIGIGVGEIVNDDDFVARILQFYGGMTSYEACSACNKNSLFHIYDAFI